MASIIINSLYLDAEKLEDDLRAILKSSLRDKDIINHFGSEIYVVPMNVDITPKTSLPAVYIQLQKKRWLRKYSRRYSSRTILSL